jgi:hypothetical protein
MLESWQLNCPPFSALWPSDSCPQDDKFVILVFYPPRAGGRHEQEKNRAPQSRWPGTDGCWLGQKCGGGNSTPFRARQAGFAASLSGLGFRLSPLNIICFSGPENFLFRVLSPIIAALQHFL